jgi:hypothetical protein
MGTLILSETTQNVTIGQLLTQVEHESVAIRSPDGDCLAIVLCPADREAWIYAEAHLDLDENRAEIRSALERRGGVTTAQLLEKASAATQ